MYIHLIGTCVHLCSEFSQDDTHTFSMPVVKILSCCAGEVQRLILHTSNAYADVDIFVEPVSQLCFPSVPLLVIDCFGLSS